ncbi:hypothetical protein TSOC_007459 [Tetrabaena socialis]|uniref:Uncharacterized protein n=1 Tax=Tetrabaena socialis TaxID=47790 RepID=A0A2J8A0Z2_9CHLO|nr:hypothetical protein TSOC_007459 [Tetrabaena socialis]|eukprot:PNH06193.1 hypothetical protein TSOC_007459 [Tetrabaena socialis]
MFGLGSSNDARFFQRLEHHEAMQKVLLEQLGAKDAQEHELLRKFEVELRANAQQQNAILNLKSDLKIANDLILGISGKRNLRGALEMVAGKLDASTTKGVQAKLDQLEMDVEFVQLLERISEQHNLRIHDVLSCLKGLYHTFSKAMHGSEPNLCIRFADVTAPAERAVLVAIFERYNLSYTCVDESGAPVNFYSPLTV